MDWLRRPVAKCCGKLPGVFGIAGYMVCCVLPCRGCFALMGGARKPKGSRHGSKEASLPLLGTRRILLLGLDGAGKSSFLWMCENREAASLPAPDAPILSGSAPLHPPTSGVLRLMRKGVRHASGRGLFDLDLCEVGGGKSIRRFWAYYIERDVAVIALFMDTTAPNRVEELAEQVRALQASLSAEAKSGRKKTPRLVLVASRVGAQGARPAPDLVRALRASCAGTGSSLDPSRAACAQLADLRGPTARESCEALQQALACAAG